jgi:hypothetical protein
MTMTNTDQKDLTFYLTEEDEGFVVHYIDSTGSEIWSEFYDSIDDIKLAYAQEIQAGQFPNDLDAE